MCKTIQRVQSTWKLTSDRLCTSHHVRLSLDQYRLSVMASGQSTRDTRDDQWCWVSQGWDITTKSETVHCSTQDWEDARKHYTSVGLIFTNRELILNLWDISFTKSCSLCNLHFSLSSSHAKLTFIMSTACMYHFLSYIKSAFCWESWILKGLTETEAATTWPCFEDEYPTDHYKGSHIKCSHLQVAHLFLWFQQRFLRGWSFQRHGRQATRLYKHSPSRSASHHPSLNSNGQGSGGTCLRGGRMLTVLEEDGCVEDGTDPGQCGCCQGW